MNYGEGGNLSAADVAVLTGRNTGNGGFGGDGENGWWVILFLIFALGGWGRNGFGGGFGGNGAGVGENYLATDFATIERKLDGVNNGLCDGFYAMAQQFSNTNQNIANSTAALQQTLCQGFSGVNQAISNSSFNTERGLWNLSSQFADCCCTTQRGLDGINYNMAINTNALQQTLCNNTRDIIENANANYRAIHEELVANKLEMKNDRIAEQQNEINALRLKASQEAQNNYLVDQLAPKCPIPAFLTCNPYTGQTYTNGYGYGCNCGYC